MAADPPWPLPRPGPHARPASSTSPRSGASSGSRGTPGRTSRGSARASTARASTTAHHRRPRLHPRCEPERRRRAAAGLRARHRSAQDRGRPPAGRPITIVVAGPAGGATDGIARRVAARPGVALGTEVVVDNQARPYDPVADFAPLGFIGGSASVLVVPTDGPGTLGALLAPAGSSPVTYGSTGIGAWRARWRRTSRPAGSGRWRWPRTSAAASSPTCRPSRN